MANIVVFTGAGISAESGLQTFRDAGGLWHQYSVQEIASPDAWRDHPELVLKFYNERRANMRAAQPNAAHHALVDLEAKHSVTIVTQNIDDLHERAGSTRVVHLHGELRLARSTFDSRLLYDCPGSIEMGDCCEKGSQLRPHVVWFGEAVENMIDATQLIKSAHKLLVVGTSLTVYPAAGLIHYARRATEKIVVAPDLEHPPDGFQWLRGRATEHVPAIVQRWLDDSLHGA